jgi:DNA-binding MarR family transcriptional regulator
MQANRELAREIVEIVTRVMRLVAAEMRQEEPVMAPAQFRALHVLTHGPVNLTTLAARLSVSTATMSRSVSSLVARRWVTRRRSEEDRRHVEVCLTPQGAQALQSAYREIEAEVMVPLQDLDPEDCAKIREGLAVMRRAFDAKGHSLCGPEGPGMYE